MTHPPVFPRFCLAVWALATVLATALAAPVAHAALAANASLFIRSDATGWVSPEFGSRFTWVHGVDGLFSIEAGTDRGARITYDDGNFWNLSFAAPTYNAANNTNVGQPLQVRSYDRVQTLGANSPTRPGFQISSFDAGYGALRESGSFNVLDVAYDSNGVVQRLAVDFEHYRNALPTGPALFGSLRVNSDIPLNQGLTPVPLPATVWLMLGGLALAATRLRRSAGASGQALPRCPQPVH